jgi:hypothetical protein
MGKKYDIAQELEEIIQRASRLKQELAPVQERAPRKGPKKRDPVQKAIDKRNARIRR